MEKEPIVKKIAEVSLASKDPERQLSKKELKKKELAELDAVLAELGYPKSESGGQDDSRGNIMVYYHLCYMFCFKCMKDMFRRVNVGKRI